MIKSFLPSATVFTSNGERIIQAIKCIEHRELGDWYIDLVAPLEYQSYLEKDYILVVPTKEKGNQPFRINNPKITDKVDVRAYHIGFDTRNYAVELSTVLNGNAQACLDELDTEIDGSHPFTFTSAIATLKSFSVVDSSLYNALIQIADEYNGILDFDGWNVTITSSIGADNGVILAYGKNIQESEINENWDLVVTKLKPIGKDGITLTPAWLTADVSYDRPYTKIMDFDSDDVTDLGFVAQLYLDRYKVPRVNYKVKADVEQNVALGDSVTVNARQFTTTAEVLSFDYNPLINRVIQVEFGNFRPTLKQFFSDQAQVIEEKAVKKAYVRIDEEIGEVETWAQNQITLAVGEKEDIFYKQDTKPFSNIALNGDFANGTTSWTGFQATNTVSNKILSNTASGASSVGTLLQDTLETYVSGNKMYFNVRVRVTNALCTQIAINLRGTTVQGTFTSITIDNPTEDEWYHVSGILTPTAGSGVYRIAVQHIYANTTNATGAVLEISNVEVVPLTADYGSGNEPSKTDMDSFINRIWLDTTNGTYKSFRGGGWNPASELKGSKFTLDNDGAKFYGDGFKLFNNAAELKVFFDLVKDAFNLSINANMPIYEPTGITELAQILNGGQKGFQFGEPSGSDYLAYITAVNMKTIAGLSEDEIRLRIRSSERLELYGDGGVRVEGVLNVVNGFTSRYDDIVFEMTPTRINPNTSKPDYDYTNLGFLFPRNVTTEIVNITVQMPHRWKEGTTIYPHVHVRQAANLQAVFKLDYIWYNAGDTIPTTWTTYTMDEYAITPYVSGTIANIVKGANGISGTGKEISSILKLKLYRDDNVYTGDMLVDQFDIHIEVDSLGSQEEYTK